MADTLAALLHETETPWGPSMSGDSCPGLSAHGGQAARLIAAGVTLAPQPDTASLVAPITVSYLYAMLAHIEAIHPVEGICNGQGECVTKYGMPAAPRPDTASRALREAAQAVLADYDLTGIDLELPDDPLMADLRAALAATEGTG